MTALTRPYTSDLYGRTVGDTRFGFEWRDSLFPIGGYRIHMAGDRIYMVENLLIATVEANRELWEVKDSTKLFMLAPDEFVGHVDADFEDGELCGLRLRTNLRMTPWYGCHGRIPVEFHAPTGCCIKALQGTTSKRKIACQLGVVYSPLKWEREHALSVVDETMHFSEPVGDSQLQTMTSFGGTCVVISKDVRAVVVAVSGQKTTWIRSIDVVSSEQYETLHADGAFLTPSEDDHWLVLADKERLVAVDVVASDYVIEGLRFTTNFCTSVWYGTSSGFRLHRTSLVAPQDMYICGFRVRDRNDTIVQLSVAYAPCPVVSANK